MLNEMTSPPDLLPIVSVIPEVRNKKNKKMNVGIRSNSAEGQTTHYLQLLNF